MTQDFIQDILVNESSEKLQKYFLKYSFSFSFFMLKAVLKIKGVGYGEIC